MPTCKLCKSAEANQTGSHLLSAFMVKTMIGDRDEEIGHLLSKESVLGYRENSGANPIKQDYILCRGCEQRLSFLESYISTEFTRKIDAEPYQQNFPLIKKAHSIPFKTSLRVNPRAFALLLYSIIWRLSVSEQSMFKRFGLTPEIEEDFRMMLDLLLPPYENFKVSVKPKNWLRMLTDTDKFKCYPHVVMKCEHTPTRDTSRNMVFIHETFVNPYQMLANEFLILLAPDRFTLSQDFFEIQRQLGAVDQLINDCSSLKIGILTESIWNDVLLIPRNAFVQQQIRVIQRGLTLDFVSKNGRTPTETELAYMTAEYIKTNWPDTDES